MDIEPWVIGLVGFVVVSVIVTVVSMFSIRETPFEEAMGSKRRELGLDLALDPTSSSGKDKHKKKDKNKDKSSNKKAGSKAAETVKAVKTPKNSTGEPEEKRTNEENKPTETVQPQTVPSIETPVVKQQTSPVVEVKPASVAKSSKGDSSKKHDHIEFKVSNEVVTLNEEEDQKLSERRVSRDDRPRKPILVKKGGPIEAEHLDDTKVVRGNSFETVHPKDEFELVKSKQLKQSEVVDGQTNGHVPGKQLVQSVNGAASNQSNKKPKNKPHTQVEIVTSKQLIEMVKNLALSDEEVQLVVNELLNKESEDSGDNWSSKNDPVAHLKKLLAEKEQALATESSNLQAAQARLRELRQEFANEKTRNSSIHQAVERFRLEVQRQQLVIQQLTERHEVEMKTLQSSLQSKLNEERNLVMARDEIKRLKEVIKKLEAERGSNLERLTLEIEQLRGEQAQRERTISTLKSSSDESQRKAAMLDDHLQRLVNDRAHEEAAREQQVKELRSQLQGSESKVHSLIEELKVVQNAVREEEEGRKSQVEQRVKQLEAEIQSLKSENATLKSSLSKTESASSQEVSELNKTLQDLRQELSVKTETISNLQKEIEKEKSLDSEKESRLKSLNEEFSRISSEKEQLSKNVSELEVQKEHLSREKSEALDILRPLKLEGGGDNLVSLVQCLASQPKGIPGVDVAELEKGNQLLSGQVEQFKQSLSQKEEALKELEKKREEESKTWEEKLKQLSSEKESLEMDRDRLSSEKKSLENTLKDLEGLQSTVIEMEEKLRDLQSKLESEELTKRELSQKYDEVRIEATSAEMDEEEKEEQAAANLVTLREQVDTQGKELQQVNEEKNRLAQLKEEIDATSEQLEKDKKSVKEVQVQNVRLKSLVKIGEDSLKAEQERVRQLEELLRVKNGNANQSSVVTSNGDGGGGTVSPTNNSTSSNPSLNQEVS